MLHVLVLPTSIDRAAGTTTASLPLYGTGGVGALPRSSAAALLNALSSALAVQDPATSEVLLRFRPKAFYNVYSSDEFILSSLVGPLDNEMARVHPDVSHPVGVLQQGQNTRRVESRVESREHWRGRAI